MTTESDHNEDAPLVNPVSNTGIAGPRMSFAIVVVAVVLGGFAYSSQAASLLQNALGFFLIPAAGFLLLSIWWLLSRSIPMRDRVIGLVLAVAAIGFIIVTHNPDGVYISSRVLPVLITSVVVALALTARMPWPAQRAAALVAILGCVGLFSALRLDNVGGDLSPNLSWRWSPPAEAVWEGAVVNPGKAASLPTSLTPGDWPAFRGPNRDSHAPGITFATDWDANPPKEVWRKPIGLGFASFAVAGDYIFTQEQRNESELVVCYDANTGDEVWINQIEARFNDGTGDGPRATPTYLDGKLYTQGAIGSLQCIDAATGETLWVRDLKEDAGSGVPEWGFSSSPLIVGDLAIVFAAGPDDKGVAAYNIDNGELAWCGGKGTHGYTSAHLAHFAETEQVVITSDVGVQSFVPGNGELLWEHEWPIRMNPRCVQPIIPDGDALLIGTAGGQGTRRINIAKTGEGWTANEQWTNKRYKPYFNDSIYFEGHCYGFDGKRLVCVDAATGDVIWKGDRYGGQVLFLPDMKMLLVFSEKGEVVLLNATPDEASVVAQFQAIEGKTWNHPVIANGKLFVRNSAEMACYELP